MFENASSFYFIEKTAILPTITMHFTQKNLMGLIVLS